MAQEYFIKGVKLYDARCCYELALIEKELNHYDVYEGLITDAIKLGSIEAKLLIANEFIKSNKSYTRNKGFTYFKDVAKTYNNEALFNAGLCYMRGKGIKKNSKKALKYLILASENGNIDSYYYIGKLYDTNKIVKINHNKALEYYLKGSEEGNVYCSYMLGKRYVEGKILQKNTEKGLDLLEEASNEIGIATFYLAKIYDEGKYVEKNIDKAIEYLNRGSNQKDPNAKFMLGFYYYNGTGVRKDKTKALTLFKEARKLGNKDAEKMLGDIR